MYTRPARLSRSSGACPFHRLARFGHLPAEHGLLARRPPAVAAEGRRSTAVTRWHGMIQATGFAPTAPATARAAVGRPMRRATSPYVAPAPGGMRSSASHTFSWKLVPARCRCSFPPLVPANTRSAVRAARRPVLAEARPRPAPAQLGERARPAARIDERQVADAARRDAEQAFAERRGVEPLGDLEPLPPLATSPGVTASAFTSRSCSRPGPESPRP